MWQDYVMMATSAAFSYALVPQVIDGFRQKRGVMTVQTAGITGVGLLILSACGLTLGLWLSSVVWSITGALWLLLLWQRVHYGAGESRPAPRRGRNLLEES